MYKSIKGFTLAEILITLLIIGVISSIVIPAVINDTNESEYNAGVKKVFADLSNALRMIQVNNGGIVNIGTSTSSSSLLRSDFCSVMTCVKQDSTRDIWEPANYKFYKGTYTGWPDNSTNAAAILNNGYFIHFGAYADCDHYGDMHACGYIWVDINGKKGPNMSGKDYHFFWIVRQNGNSSYSLIPAGAQNDLYTSQLPGGCVAGSSGWSSSRGCTAKRLMDPDHMP